jgi:hypothetical protein
MSKLTRALAELAKRADAGDEVALQGIRAYHGSPHDFPPVRELEMPDGAVVYQHMDDAVPEGARVIKEHPLGRFDMSKLGTGEGAQAYSRGLYFAEREATGQSYRDALKGNMVTTSDGVTKTYGQHITEVEDAIRAAHPNLNPDNIRAAAKSVVDDNLTDADVEGMGQWEGVYKSGIAANKNAQASKGSMYEVNIAATPDEFIDWDLPLDEQSESVMNALNKTDWYQYAEEGAYNAAERRGDNAYGMDLVRWLEEDGAEDAVQMLKDAGIKGVQYADAQTRFGKGPKTKNYVVYDDKLISIAKKYGISIPAAAAVLAGTMTPEEAQAVGFGSVVKKSLSGKTDEIQQGIGSLPAGDEMVAGGDLQFLMNKLVREQSVKQAKEQGYDLDNVMYHASKQDIEEFVPGYSDGLTFLTPNKEFANDWLGKGKFQERQGGTGSIEGVRAEKKRFMEEQNEIMKSMPEDQRQQYFKEVVWPQRSRMLTEEREADSAIYPLVTRTKKPFVPSKDVDVLEELYGKEYLDAPFGSGFPTYKDALKDGNYLLYENKEVVDFLKSKGYDSMFLKENSGADKPFTTLAVFDPNNIRSVNAKFDPKKKDSPQILASNPFATGITGLGAMAALPPEEAEAGGMGVRMPPTAEDEEAMLAPTGGDLMQQANRDFVSSIRTQPEPDFLTSVQQQLLSGIMKTAGVADLSADVVSAMAGPLLSAPGAIARYAADRYVPGVNYSAEEMAQGRRETEDYFNYQPRTELGPQYGEQIMQGIGGAIAPYVPAIKKAAGDSYILGAMRQGYDYLGDKEKMFFEALGDIFSPI